MATSTNHFVDNKITIDPDICNGKPTIRGKRIAVQMIIEFLSVGESPAEILRQYLSLDASDIDQMVALTKGNVIDGSIAESLQCP